ncbi:MAG TPA: hypothetical protein VEB64_07705 [Azospirillaceae bacterium]|nr:hypothetical protein [Azospirillaceae bacterium]
MVLRITMNGDYEFRVWAIREAAKRETGDMALALEHWARILERQHAINQQMHRQGRRG